MSREVALVPCFVAALLIVAPTRAAADDPKEPSAQAREAARLLTADLARFSLRVHSFGVKADLTSVSLVTNKELITAGKNSAYVISAEQARAVIDGLVSAGQFDKPRYVPPPGVPNPGWYLSLGIAAPRPARPKLYEWRLGAPDYDLSTDPAVGQLLKTLEGDSKAALKRLASLQAAETVVPSAFGGAKAGDEREVCGIKLCWCPPGKFLMGSPRSEPERRPGEDQVAVTLTKGFWMAKYEATQGQWRRVAGKLPGELTAELPAGDDYPVGNVNFAEAEAFCQKLTELGRKSGDLPQEWEFRLPTEAQWEYACRAGTTTYTSFGDKLSSKQANFKGNPYNGAEPGPSLNRAAQVGSYPANAWGLHDMHGNTFEWCRDWYHLKLPGGADPDLGDAKNSATKNEQGDVSRVRRGGCWADHGWPCRSAFRLRFEPERRYDHIGFRVVAVRP